MNLLSSLFSYMFVRHWSYALLKRTWSEEMELRLKSNIFSKAKQYDFSPWYAEELSNLGPWNM